MDKVLDRWEPLDATGEERERIGNPSRGFWQDVWTRFCRKRTALFGAVMLVFVAAFALLGPSLSPHTYYGQTTQYANIPPLMKITKLEGHENGFYVTPYMELVEIDSSGRIVSRVALKSEDMVKKQMYFDVSGEEVILDYSASPVALLDSDGARVLPTERVWNRTYLLGSDQLGRDILTRLMYGCRISLAVAMIAAVVNMLIGIVYGGISGYLGGRVDSVMMRVVDIISTIPLTLYVILIKVILGSGGFLSIVIALSSVYWVNMARVVRGETLSLKNQEFVLAARSIGTRSGDILARHIVPNAMGPILVTATMLIPSAIFIEAFLSFIGIGIAPPMASLGTMCNDALGAMRTSPFQLLMPGLMVCIIMFAFSFIGDGLRDALDPKLKT